MLLVESGAKREPGARQPQHRGRDTGPPTAIQPYDLLRHEHLVLSREAAAKLSRSLSATRPEVPVQIEPARCAGEKGCAAEARKRKLRRRRQPAKAKSGEEARGEKRS